MRKFIWISVLVFVIAALAVAGSRLFYYYNGFSSFDFYGLGAQAYTPPDRPLPPAAIEASAGAARFETVDNPAVSKGVVVVDYAHDNAFFVEEINVLLSKIVSRGFSYELILPGEQEEGESSSRAAEATNGWDDKLRYADALILPLPRREYTPEEITKIERFVEKGGRVLIIGDPTRTVVVEALNSIAGSFGLIYANDYLYSLENNDNNYRNVVYSNFKESPLTQGLTGEQKVVFYGGGSIVAPGQEIILGDETTFSSISEGGRTMAAAALAADDRVLALADLTFFSEPYSAAEGNGTFINNIANFLAHSSVRDYDLQDFPYFFDTGVNVVFSNSRVFNSQFADSVKLKSYLENHDRMVTFSDSISDTGSSDLIFVGRFADAGQIQNYLDEAGITILESPETEDEAAPTTPDIATSNRSRPALNAQQPPGEEERYVKGRIQIASVGDLEMGGSTLFYLNRNHDRNILIILSESADTNADAFELLLENRLDTCRISATISVCQTQEPNGGLPPSMRSARIDNILIVGSDTGRPRDYEATGMLEFNAVLSATYGVDTWLTSENGSPDVDQLLEYDAVIWTTGDYWDDSLNEEDAALLTQYIEMGGNLILSGASIAFDWDHTDFLTHVAHADYQTTGEQVDLEVGLPDHPLAEGFTESPVLTFTAAISTTSNEPLPVDVVSKTSDARAVFKRGPASEAAGEASVIAFEDDRAKVAYFAFPIYLLPDGQRDLLIHNTVQWFTKKPLALPDGSEEDTAGEDEIDNLEDGTGTEEDTGGDQTGDEGGTGGEDQDSGEGDQTGDEGDSGGDDQDGGGGGENEGGEATGNEGR